jgi:hypothetical protein
MIFLLVLGSGVAIFNVLKLANLAEDMYKHHLVASNIVRDINIKLLTMQRDMKNALLSANNDDQALPHFP